MGLSMNIKRLPPPNNIRIRCLRGSTSKIVTWDPVRNADADISTVMYNIYKGLSVKGIFYKLNNQPLITNRYEDLDVHKNPNITNWYKISSIYLDVNQKLIEGPLSNPVIYEVINKNRWFNKMNERNMWILKNTGQLFDLYTRKCDGEHCPTCYDSVRGRSGTAQCSVCYGTGFVGGYEPMFQLYIREKTATNDLAITSQGQVWNNAPGAWTITTTPIQNRDLLFNPEGKIYSVINSHTSQAAGYLFHQELQLKELDPTDPLYQMERTTLYPML